MRNNKNYFCLKNAIFDDLNDDKVAIVHGLFCSLLEKTLQTSCGINQRCVFVAMGTITRLNLYHKACFAGKGLNEKEFLKSFFSEENSAITDNFSSEQRALMISKIDTYLTENDCLHLLNNLTAISLSLQKETK
jgi:hypothetical protein